VGLTEEIYEDKENTDRLERLKSVRDAPYVISVGLIRDESADTVVMDCDDFET